MEDEVSEWREIHFLQFLIFSLLAPDGSEASMGASYFWDRVIGYFCAKGVQHTSDKSGGELVTEFGGYSYDGASAVIGVQYIEVANLGASW